LIKWVRNFVLLTAILGLFGCTHVQKTKEKTIAICATVCGHLGVKRYETKVNDIECECQKLPKMIVIPRTSSPDMLINL
jgi:hypothetical protein